jgi:glycosyltransferase involved in cell wall biosynthesis
MISPALDVSIVIPAFNEAARLPATLEKLGDLLQAKAFQNAVIREVIVVDDGSTDNTIAVARRFESALPGFSVVSSERNFGKGHAVRTGLARATQPWALVADADMSTPWLELDKLVHESQKTESPIAIGSRDTIGSQVRIHQSFIRESLGKTFNVFVRMLTTLPFKDTQCGFKLVQMSALGAILDRLTIDRFAWDVELLLLAKQFGLEAVEVPVVWEHKEESRVSLFSDGLGMVGSVLKIRLRLLTQFRLKKLLAR